MQSSQTGDQFYSDTLQNEGFYTQNDVDRIEPIFGTKS